MNIGVSSGDVDEPPSLRIWPSSQEIGVILWEGCGTDVWLRCLSKRGIPEEKPGYRRLENSNSGEDREHRGIVSTLCGLFAQALRDLT